MVESPLFTPRSLRELIARGEGQFLELKALWDFDNTPPRPLSRRHVRDMIAENVAALANADGGTLVLGVDDDGTPSGHGYPAEAVAEFVAVPERRLRPSVRVAFQTLSLDGREVIAMDVPRAPRAVMVEGDGFPYRVSDTVRKESEVRINALKEEYLDRGVEQRFVDAATRDDLDLSLLPEAVEDRDGWLRTRGLVLPRHGTPAVTQAAVLLLGRPPVIRWHANAGVRFFRVAGTERRHGRQRNVTQIDRLELPIAELIPAAYEVARGQIRRSEQLHSLFFREVPEYPTFAWQEALVNAIAHRDYRDAGRGIEVWFYDDRMEVVSPGGPAPPVTMEALRTRHPVHASRNPAVARVLVELGLMREEGEGIPRMYEEMEGSLLRPPELRLEADDRFVVVLRNVPIFEIADESWRHLVDSLGATTAQKRVLLAHPHGFTNEDFRRLNAVDRDEAYRQIQEMVSQGIVESASGHGRGARYHLTPNLRNARVWLDRRVPAVRAHLAEHDALTNAQYREIFGVTRATAVRELRRLVEEGYLRLVGERRGSRYVRGRGLQE